MTPCENYWEALNAFVDGECSPEEEACREALAELTALRGGFPHWEDEEIPEGFADGVLQRIAGTPQQAPKKARRKHRAAWASLAACLGIMVKGMVGIFIVILVIWALVAILNKVTSPKK